MKNKSFASKIVMFGLIGGITVAGCTGTQSEKAVAKTNASKTASTQCIDKTLMSKKITYSDYDRFTLFKDAKIPCNFTSTSTEPIYDEPNTITGSYDLNQDGIKDDIKFDMVPDTEYDMINVKLDVNGQEWQGYLPSPGDAYIVDLDTSDSYYEVVLYDEGFSCDPNFNFYRYDGKQLKYLGAFNTFFSDALALDGHNHLTAKDSFLGTLDTPMLKSYATQKGDHFEEHKFNLKKAEHKTYTITDDTDDGLLSAYFIETKQSPDKVDYTWSEDQQIKLHKGDKITINKFLDWERYQVQLEDGRVGILYFWIGD